MLECWLWGGQGAEKGRWGTVGIREGVLGEGGCCGEHTAQGGGLEGVCEESRSQEGMLRGG